MYSFIFYYKVHFQSVKNKQKGEPFSDSLLDFFKNLPLCFLMIDCIKSATFPLRKFPLNKICVVFLLVNFQVGIFLKFRTLFEKFCPAFRRTILFYHFPGGLICKAGQKCQQKKPFVGIIEIVEGVLILRNSFRKLKMVVDNAILQNHAVSSENISERIKIQTENDFPLKRNVCIFRRNENCIEKYSHRRYLSVTSKKRRQFPAAR